MPCSIQIYFSDFLIFKSIFKSSSGLNVLIKANEVTVYLCTEEGEERNIEIIKKK